MKANFHFVLHGHDLIALFAVIVIAMIIIGRKVSEQIKSLNQTAEEPDPEGT